MEKFTTLTSTVIPLDMNNVDTDMIIPAYNLKSISKSGYGENLFSELKKMYPDFILNKLEYNSGKILLSRANFGCGSSREHAVWAIQQYGITAVVCSSFSDIFFNNSAKNGLLLITVPEDIIAKWLSASLADNKLEMNIDLEKEQINFMGASVKFHYDKFRKHCLLNGLDDLDYLLSQEEDIKRYERNK
jgi:3-isopropylmalate/(R)-2-methylmalate dehydratase small subunit